MAEIKPTVTVHLEREEEYYSDFWVVESRVDPDDFTTVAAKVLVFPDEPGSSRAERIANRIAEVLRTEFS